METDKVKSVECIFFCNIYNHRCFLDKILNYSTPKRKGRLSIFADKRPIKF